jgi:hypothetical protein
MANPPKTYTGKDLIALNMMNVYEDLVRGLTVTEICKKLGVSRYVYYDMIKTDPHFRQMVADAEAAQTDRVRQALLNKCSDREIVREKVLANGKKVKYLDVLPADFNAIKFWLLNKTNGEFKDKQEIEVTDNTIKVDIIDDVAFEIVENVEQVEENVEPAKQLENVEPAKQLENGKDKSEG